MKTLMVLKKKKQKHANATPNGSPTYRRSVSALPPVQPSRGLETSDPIAGPPRRISNSAAAPRRIGMRPDLLLPGSLSYPAPASSTSSSAAERLPVPPPLSLRYRVNVSPERRIASRFAILPRPRPAPEAASGGSRLHLGARRGAQFRANAP